MFFFAARSAIKSAAGGYSRRKMASISHTSITGRKKSFERTRLIKRHVGTANSNEAAAAEPFSGF